MEYMTTEADLVGERISPNLKIGDAIIFSTLSIHKSLPQSRNNLRVTTQFRYGNFLQQDAVNRLWPVGQLEGRTFDLDHPEYVAS